MRTDLVVVLLPLLDRGSGIREAREPVEVQAVLSELAIEALHERVLRRFAGLDEVQLHAGSLRPEEHRFAGELRPLSQTIVSGSGRLSRSNSLATRCPEMENSGI